MKELLALLLIFAVIRADGDGTTTSTTIDSSEEDMIPGTPSPPGLYSGASFTSGCQSNIPAKTYIINPCSTMTSTDLTERKLFIADPLGVANKMECDFTYSPTVDPNKLTLCFKNAFKDAANNHNPLSTYIFLYFGTDPGSNSYNVKHEIYTPLYSSTGNRVCADFPLQTQGTVTGLMALGPNDGCEDSVDGSFSKRCNMIIEYTGSDTGTPLFRAAFRMTFKMSATGTPVSFNALRIYKDNLCDCTITRDFNLNVAILKPDCSTPFVGPATYGDTLCLKVSATNTPAAAFYLKPTTLRLLYNNDVNSVDITDTMTDMVKVQGTTTFKTKVQVTGASIKFQPVVTMQNNARRMLQDGSSKDLNGVGATGVSPALTISGSSSSGTNVAVAAASVLTIVAAAIL